MVQFGIGQAVRRVEDKRFLTGRGRYVDDINLPRQTYMSVILSPHAHARITGIDSTAALAAPGVLCVLTGADVLADGLSGFTAAAMPEDLGAPKGHRTFRPILVHDRVRCVGDRVAIVIAETGAQARDAADLVDIQYEVLPSTVNVEDAVRDGAPKVWDECPTGNVAWGLMFGSAEAADAAFASAAHVISMRLENNRLSANPIEPRGALGSYDSGGDAYTLYTSTQNPHGARQTVSAVLGISETRLHVIGPDVGGGFGMKGDSHPEEALVVWASKRCGRPVKWTATRAESLIGDHHGRDQVVFGEMALDATGKMLGIRARTLHAVGAYISQAGLVASIFSLRFIPGAYDVQAVHVVNQGIFTHTQPLAPYRGAGRPEATYLTERLLDQAALVIGIDPVEIRRRNLIRPEALPYTTPTFYTYDSGDFPGLLGRCLTMADWDGFANRRVATERSGKRRGRAVTYFIEQGGVFNDRMELRFDPGGSVTIVAGTFNHGQGHETTYGQMVAQWLGVPFDKIRFVQGDTDQVPFGRGTYAARSSMIGGAALMRAADSIVQKARPMAAALLEASVDDIEFGNGRFSVVGTERGLSLPDVARAFYYPMGITDQFGVGLEASGTYSTTPENFPNGCHVCEVEVDVDTGDVRIDRYFVIDDVGMVVNPLICEGQVHGGLAQGIGQALFEHMLYDRDSGQVLSGSFSDYAMPRASVMPQVTSALEETPATTNPLGIKGIGEAGAIGAPPTVINAILDALRPLGVGHLEMPATPAHVWSALQAAKS